jgi:uncharacterized protein YcfJ
MNQGVLCGRIYTMKATIFFTALMAVGCASNTGTGILAGATLGSSAGGLIGGGQGSAIGAAAAAITCGLIGAALDEQDRKVMEKSSPRTVDRMERKDPLTLNDIIKLSQGGVSDDAIIRYLNDIPGQYELSQAQVRRLRDSGVSQRVIHFMLDSHAAK